MLMLNVQSKKLDGCANNPENSSTTKIRERIACGYSMSTISEFVTWKTNILYIVEIFMKKFCEHLREHAKNVIDFENKKMLPITKKN